MVKYPLDWNYLSRFNGNCEDTIKFAEQNLSLPWNWTQITKRKDNNWNLIDRYSYLPWDWNVIGNSHSVYWDFVIKHYDKDWDWEKLSQKEGWRVLVSIADVSHFVRENSYIDKEARLRGNSVYLPNYVIPMLPEELSNNLCSLKPNLDRACLTVEIILDKNGLKKSHSFYRSIINSKKRLTYNEVENIINNKFIDQSIEPNILKVIKSLQDVYKILENIREKRGALNLELPEKKIVFDEDGWPQDIKNIYGVTSNKIIEELMALQGEGVDLGGYYHTDPIKVRKIMRPSKTFNQIIP